MAVLAVQLILDGIAQKKSNDTKNNAISSANKYTLSATLDYCFPICGFYLSL